MGVLEKITMKGEQVCRDAISDVENHRNTYYHENHA